ncbi:hypothetical protein [Actinobacillus lignieresii]|uniref:Uncharacterized protein n=1 Tax=Actinobacillus lignieresii TaxID=720 RepID=A0A380TUQ9_ACTLI|nr:hypothetical protein [Actinobacillus lignieresii]SUT91475.1 Uncharacterised protein [Actinobacillus lignieresii]
MSVSINLDCPVCGSSTLKVRTSQKIGMLVTQAKCYCPSCLSVSDISAEITRTYTANWNERPEIKRINKPLKQVDPNQLDFFDEK